MNKRKVRKLRETVTPKPYFTSFNYPLEDPKKPSSPAMDLSDYENAKNQMMDEDDQDFIDQSKAAQSEINKIAPTHMRRSTKIFFPKNQEDNESSKGIQLLKSFSSFQKRSERSQTFKNKIEDQTTEKKFGLKTQKFTPEHILSRLNYTKLTSICEQFQNTKNGTLQLHDFIRILKQMIKHDKEEEEFDLINGCVQLFKEIDINGDESMSFEEFASYLIEAVEARKLSARDMKDQIKDPEIFKQDETIIPSFMRFSDLLHKAETQKPPDFRFSHLVKYGKSLNRTNAFIEKAQLYRKLDAIVLSEHRQKKVKMISACSNQSLVQQKAELKMLQELQLPVDNGSFILSVAVNEKDGVIAITSSESLVYFWTHFQGNQVFKLNRVVCTHEYGNQTGIWYLPKHGIWMTAIGGSTNFHGQKKQTRANSQLKKEDEKLSARGMASGSGQGFGLLEWYMPTSRELSHATAQICEACNTKWLSKVDKNHFIEQANVTEYQIELPTKFIKTEFRDLFKDTIKDCIEIHYPILAVVVACHDAKIRFLKMETKSCIKELDTHQFGIRQLDFTPYHGGSLLSVGYETYFNVWNIDRTQSFPKTLSTPQKFDNISSPVCGARFMRDTQFIASVDNQAIVKIWNYMNFEHVQSIIVNELQTMKPEAKRNGKGNKIDTSMQDLMSINIEKGIQKEQIQGMIMLSSERFAIISKQLYFFDRKIERGEPDKILERKKPLEEKIYREIRQQILGEKERSELEEAEFQHRNDQVLPAIDSCFVTHYKTFIVITKDNLRIYNAKNGRLQKYMDNSSKMVQPLGEQQVHKEDALTESPQISARDASELRLGIKKADPETKSNEENEKTPFVDNTAFCLDDIHRKIYIGDTAGTIRCFNVSSGAIIKKFDTKDNQQRKSKDSNQMYDNEISSLKHYSWIDKHSKEKKSILISSHVNEKLYAWDVTDDFKTEKLKAVQGGHLGSNVATMAISEHLSVIATGSYAGTISLWDLEAFKQIGFLKGHKMPVSAIEFVPEHPLVVSTALCGIVCVHAVRGAPLKLVNVCLAKFVNLDGGVWGVPVKETPKKGNKNEKIQESETEEEQLLKPYYNCGISACVLSYKDHSNDKKQQEKREAIQKQREDMFKRVEFNPGVDPEPKDSYFETEFQPNDKIDEYEPIWLNSDPLTFKKNKDGKLLGHRERVKLQNDTSDKYFRNYYPPTLESCNKTLHLAIGDEDGRMKIYNLTRFIDWCDKTDHELEEDFSDQREAYFAKCGLDQDEASRGPGDLPFHQKIEDYLPPVAVCDDHISMNPIYQPGREVTHNSNITNVTHMFQEQASLQERMPILDALRCVQVKECFRYDDQSAHTRKINSLREIPHHPWGLVSTSEDKHVRVWSYKGDLVGDINLVHEKVKLDKWDFQFDWANSKRQQMIGVKKMIKEMAQQKKAQNKQDANLPTIDENDDISSKSSTEQEDQQDTFEEFKELLHRQQTTTIDSKRDAKNLLKKLLPEYTARHNDAQLVYEQGGYKNIQAMDGNSKKVQQIKQIDSVLQQFEKPKHNMFASDTGNFEDLQTNSLKPINQKSKSTLRGSTLSQLGITQKSILGATQKTISTMQASQRSQGTQATPSSKSRRNSRKQLTGAQSLPNLPSYKDARHPQINDLGSGVPMPGQPSPLHTKRIISSTIQDRFSKPSNRPVMKNASFKSTFEVHANDPVIELMESKTLTKNASIPQLAPIKKLEYDDDQSQNEKKSKTPQRKRKDNSNQIAAVRNEFADIEKKINAYQGNVTKISDAYQEAQKSQKKIRKSKGAVPEHKLLALPDGTDPRGDSRKSSRLMQKQEKVYERPTQRMYDEMEERLKIKLFTDDDRPRKVETVKSIEVPNDVKMFGQKERKIVQGVNLTRNHSGKFLTKLSKFIDGKNNNVQTEKYYKGEDMKHHAGEVNRQIRVTLAQLNDKSYAEYTADRDMHTIGAVGGGKKILRRLVQHQSIKKSKQIQDKSKVRVKKMEALPEALTYEERQKFIEAQDAQSPVGDPRFIIEQPLEHDDF